MSVPAPASLPGALRAGPPMVLVECVAMDAHVSICRPDAIGSPVNARAFRKSAWASAGSMLRPLVPGIVAGTAEHRSPGSLLFSVRSTEHLQLCHRKRCTPNRAKWLLSPAFAAAFAVAGEDQEKVADEETLVLLKRFSGNPDVEKAKVEFERAQKVEEKFHKDFDGVDFTGNQLPPCDLS
jgi:hypothetical protein